MGAGPDVDAPAGTGLTRQRGVGASAASGDLPAGVPPLVGGSWPRHGSSWTPLSGVVLGPQDVCAGWLAAPYTCVVLHRLVLVLLCACLALQGGGLVLASEAPCPMEAEMIAMVQAGDLDPADLPDCCNDLQTWAETGQLCKTGLDCQGLVAWAPAPVTASVGSPPSSGPPPALNARATRAPPGATWRPPAAG